MTISSILQIIIGFIGLICIAVPFSQNKSSINYRHIVAAIFLQIVLAFALLKIPFIVQIFAYLSEGVTALQAATQEGAEFVFGYLSNSSTSPFESSGTGNSMIFAFQILPLIIVISSLSALLWFWNILPLIIRAISKIFEKLFNIFKELIIHTSGDFDEAIEWLRELDKEYKLTDENYTIDDFVNDLLKKGYIRKEISANGDSIKISSKTERLLRKHVLKHLFGNLKKTKKGNHKTKYSSSGSDENLNIKDFEFGDPLDRILLTESLKNAIISFLVISFDDDYDEEDTTKKTMTTTTRTTMKTTATTTATTTKATENIGDKDCM